MPTPKDRFLEQKALVATHRDVVVTTAFQAASDAAMLALVDDLAKTSQPPDQAAAAFHAICGARKYRILLETIGDAPQPLPPKRQTDNLNHTI